MENKQVTKLLTGNLLVLPVLLPLVLVAFWFTACGSSNLEERFDAGAWRADKAGCEGKRQAMLKEFQSIEQELQGMSELETRKLLGKPDKVELYERSQKFYIYYIEPGSQCENSFEANEGKHYYIRFNSLNQVNEVSLQIPVPS